MKKNLITIAKNFVGTKGFRNFYQNDKDILNNGDVSCAFFVSTVLAMCKLVDRVYFTVDNLSKYLEESTLFETFLFPKVEEISAGDVIIWDTSEGGHKHIGFCVAQGVAVSNRSSLGAPGEHELVYSGFDKVDVDKERKILRIYRLKNL